MQKNNLLEKWSHVDVGKHGFVKLIDIMGDDQAIVDAARNSYGKGTKKVSTNRGLIRYLVRNKHTSPIEMCEIKLQIKIPMDIWRQWVRHRTASINEYSTRYSVAITQFNDFIENAWRLQSQSNNQGSEGFLDEERSDILSDLEQRALEACLRAYNTGIEMGVAREQIRRILPLSTYTTGTWKVDLHNLLHFLRLRIDLHAQKEIREFAEVIYQIVCDWVPYTAEAFEDYILNSVNMTSNELKIIMSYVDKEKIKQDLFLDEEKARIHLFEQGIKNKREANEFIQKIGAFINVD